MYIDIGNDIFVDDKEIILFQDFERLTESKYGIELVQNLEKENKINYVDIERIPKTLILCEKNQEYFAYLTYIPLSNFVKYNLKINPIEKVSYYVRKKNNIK